MSNFCLSRVLGGWSWVIKVPGAQGSEFLRSDGLKLDAVCGLRDRLLLFVLCTLFHLSVFEQQRDQLLVEPAQVLRILRPGQILSPLHKRPDRVAPHQLVVRHLQAEGRLRKARQW